MLRKALIAEESTNTEIFNNLQFGSHKNNNSELVAT